MVFIKKINMHIKFSISTCKNMYFKQLYMYYGKWKKKIGVVVREGRFYFAI